MFSTVVPTPMVTFLSGLSWAAAMLGASAAAPRPSARAITRAEGLIFWNIMRRSRSAGGSPG